MLLGPLKRLLKPNCLLDELLITREDDVVTIVNLRGGLFVYFFDDLVDFFEVDVFSVCAECFHQVATGDGARILLVNGFEDFHEVTVHLGARDLGQ